MESTTATNDSIKLVFNDLNEFNLKMNDNKTLKSADESTALRKKGNEVFLKNVQAARLLYNKSIALAPYPLSKEAKSRELAVAFADRSRLFYVLNKYEGCLKDIEQALLFDYPKKHVDTLCKRKDKCLENINKFHLGSVNAHQITYGQHKVIDCASDCVDVRRTAELGKHLVATSDIFPGDVVIVEKPFASILWPEYYFTHCYNCLQRQDSLIPCKHCSTAMYCSDICRNASWETFHNIECPFLSTLVESGTEINLLLALRILLVACHNCGNGLRGLYNQSLMDKTVDENKNNIDFEDQDKISLQAACIVTCLEMHTNFFEQCSDGDTISNSPDLKLFAGTMLAKYVMTVSSDSFSLKDVVTRVGQRVPTVVEFGSAVYTTVSLIKRSCDGNVISCFQRGNNQAIIAIQPIKKGEVLSLSRDFKCTGSEEESDDSQSPIPRPNTKLRFKCVECNAPLPLLRVSARPASISTCFWCKNKNDLNEIEENYRNLYDSYVKIKNSINYAIVRPESDVSDLANILIVLGRIVCPPCNLGKKCQDLLQTCLLTRGNFFTLP